MLKKLIIFSSILLFFTTCISSKGVKYRRLNTKQDHSVWVVAHRALTGEGIFPENSIPTIQSCIDNQIEIMEIDVRETKDGELIVIHDKTVDRTTNAKGLVSDFTLEGIKKLKLKHDGKLTNYAIPTLEEVFELIKHKIVVDLDIKLDHIDSYQKIANLVEKHQMSHQIIVFLYDKEDIKAAHAMFKNANIMPRARSICDIDYINQLPYINIIHIDEKSYQTELMKNLIAANKRIWMNTLGKYDQLEKTKNNGFKEFFATYPNVNVVQTDLAVQLKKYLSSQNK